MKKIIINPTELFFTSDLHLDHENIIKLCHRPFSDINEMNNTLIDNWNKVVTKNGIVFVLGDFCWSKDEKIWNQYVSKLNGVVYFLQGNHDEDIVFKNSKMITMKKEPLIDIIINDQQVTLCHYPMLSWNQSHRGAWQLFGHWHSITVDNTVSTKSLLEKDDIVDYVREEYSHAQYLRPTQYDVGVDGNNFTPVNFAQITELITNRLKLLK